MSSLAVHRDDDWCFAFAPAKEWVLAYVRKPELRRGRIDFERVKQLLPNAQKRADGEITVRLHTPAEMQEFLSLF